MRNPLSEAERRALEVPGAPSAALGATGWNLSGRRVSDLELVGLRLTPSAWEETDCERVVFRNLDWSQPRFVGVKFEDCEFQDSRLTGARFERCEFRRVTFRRTTLDRPLFEACQMLSTSIQGGSLQDARISRCTVSQARLHDVQLDRVTIRDSDLQSATVQAGSWAGVSIFGGSLLGFRATNTPITELLLDGTRVDGAEFSLNPISAIEVRGATGGRITFADVRCDSLVVQGLSLFHALSAMRSTFAQLAIERCVDFSGLNLFRCDVGRLGVRRSGLHFSSFEQCRLNGPGLIEETTLDGFLLTGSQVTDLTLKDVKLSAYLKIPGAVFTRLRLSGVQRDPALRLLDDGVRYDRSDSFIGLS